MEQKTNNWLSGDSRIEPPPKREWYGERPDISDYSFWIDYYEKRVGEHAISIGFVCTMLAVLATWPLAFYIADQTNQIILVVSGIILSIILSFLLCAAITAAWVRIMATRAHGGFHAILKSKPSFKQTFKFGKQNGSK